MSARSEPPRRAPEDPLFEAFEVFREHVVEVSEGFHRRVRRRLETVRRDDEDPRLGAVVTSLFVEAFNLLGLPDLEEPPDPPEEDEGER